MNSGSEGRFSVDEKMLTIFSLCCVLVTSSIATTVNFKLIYS